MLSEHRRHRNERGLGSIIKAAREKSGYTQKALADSLGLEYYTMISQMELGYVSIPPALWIGLCSTLGLDRSEFVLRCLREYQPDVYKSLFDNRGLKDTADVLSAYRKGQIVLS